MLDNGYIKLHRSIMNWEWYSDIYTFYVFVHLLMTVSIEDSQWRGIEVKRGERVTSYAKLASETGLTEKRIRTCINRLERTGSVARCKYPKYTVFTVLSFDKFQTGAGKQAAKGQARGRVGAGKGQEYNNIKEDNKKIKEKESAFGGTEFHINEGGDF